MREPSAQEISMPIQRLDAGDADAAAVTLVMRSSTIRCFNRYPG